MGKSIVVLGSGGWGTALGIAAHDAGNKVTVWSLFEQEIENIQKSGENPLLPGIQLPEGMRFTSSLACLADADICIMAVPSVAVRETAKRVAPVMEKKTVIVSVAKGLEKGSLKRLSQVIGEELDNPVVVLSGPSHAEEVARKLPTTVTAASPEAQYSQYIQKTLSSSSFRIYTNPDVIGVELCGTVKNVIALAAGICDGLGFGDNTKAALMTRGIHEIVRLGTAMGGKNETFSGLAGIGDLIVTCTSMHSRNRRAGILIGKGMPVEEAIAQIGTVEGYHATKNIWDLSRQIHADMPITDECYSVLYQGVSPLKAINDLMTRPYKPEYQEDWLK